VKEETPMTGGCKVTDSGHNQFLRGKPAGDRVALIDALIRLAGIASAMEDCVAEIDVNPIIVLPDRRGVRALDALVVLRHSVDEVVKEAAEGTA
jgi:hypothetical protein